MDDLLPLFPLNVVLFPRMPLPLHIFEPRYKLMIRWCLSEEAEFGVILSGSEGIAHVGCAAGIVRVTKEYEDERLDILTEGRRRFRVLELFEDLPYLQGRTAEFEDEDEIGPTPSLSESLTGLYEEAFRLVRDEPLPPLNTPAPLSFAIAHELPLSVDYKQELLELRSENERQLRLAAHLKEWIALHKRVARVKAKAAGNGHGR